MKIGTKHFSYSIIVSEKRIGIVGIIFVIGSKCLRMKSYVPFSELIWMLWRMTQYIEKKINTEQLYISGYS